MEIGHFKQLDQKNRCHLPKDLTEVVGIEDNAGIYISFVPGEAFLRVYPKAYVDKIFAEAKAKGGTTA